MFNERNFKRWIDSWGDFNEKLKGACWKNGDGYCISDGAMAFYFPSKPNCQECEPIATFNISDWARSKIKEFNSERININVKAIKNSRDAELKKLGLAKDYGNIVTFANLGNTTFSGRKVIELCAIMGDGATYFHGSGDMCPLIAYPEGTYDVFGILMPIKI